jgi:hypothetical protein
MTRERTLKTTIRARMARTGERYTTARRHVLSASTPPPPRPAPTAAYPGPMPGPAADARLIGRTGHGFLHWFGVLDDFGGRAKGHTAAARHLHDDHGVPGWHAQEITVAWERATGQRAVNQRLNGAFEVSVSKVLPVDVPAAARALEASTARSAWIRGIEPSLVKALVGGLRGKDATGVTDGANGLKRCRFAWDGSRVELQLIPRADGRATAIAVVTKLPDAAAVEARRTQWRAALTALATHLAPRPATPLRRPRR